MKIVHVAVVTLARMFATKAGQPTTMTAAPAPSANARYRRDEVCRAARRSGQRARSWRARRGGPGNWKSGYNRHRC
jgi:hypothetical protein